MDELQLKRPGKAAVPVAVPAFALWQLGFRPFYLLASIFSAISVGLWTLQYSGWLEGAYLKGPLWHGHEMLFGYTLAVIVGFLLTAVRNWTGLPTPAGAPLAALAALWVLGRILVFTPWSLAAALANAAFPFAAAAMIAAPIARSRNRRNYFFIALLVLFGLIALATHAALNGVVDVSPLFTLQLALDLVLFIMVVMAGRVVPMFTNNGVPGANATRRPWIERLALGSIIALFLADHVPAMPALAGAVALVAAIVHAGRLALWQSWRTLRTPLVWVLHLAYAWIVIHLLLRALAAAGWVAEPLALHALTLGAIGVLTIGMITRTARGHTARPLKADGYETAAYLLVCAAALARVFGPMLLPAYYAACVQVSGLLWVAAFGLYAVRYWPVLTRPRLDGKPG
ncbi:MAG: NnrS family protein [Lautropia sp.]|nr:MAG: NnrS family protein [Pseudomonadota bacterium]MBC6958146.1 NnrS family protein [Lautropia sp.]MCL4700276.1 NnrS family protein [Burkholderiaceae bacterium]MDL1906825.1 NnrS family protein [Betaproteobacteria bacterium PRO1]RIK90719.1 MAG: NnrS family protein [Burkholderiales bacterium]